jgi:hypothetical protein
MMRMSTPNRRPRRFIAVEVTMMWPRPEPVAMNSPMMTPMIVCWSAIFAPLAMCGMAVQILIFRIFCHSEAPTT